MQSDIKWIWFDICGTIVDVDNIRLAEELSRTIIDVNAVQILQVLDSEKITDEFELGKLSANDVHTWFALRFDNGFSRINVDDFSFIWCQYSSRMEEALGVLHNLCSVYKVGLASNIDPLFFEHVLDICPELQGISSQILSFEIGYRKPDKEFFEEILSRSECAAAEIIYIDDNIDNISVANKTKMHTVLINENESLRKVLQNDYNIQI